MWARRARPGEAKEGQNDTYHIIGENIALVSLPSFSETMKKMSLKMFYMAELTDEYIVQQLK
eukprot:4480262-Heterocapsa_arctica.AAC.1